MNEATHRREIPLFKVFMPESVMQSLKQTLFGGYIGEGPRALQFESALATWLGVHGVVTVNSGTAALHLALRLAGVGLGDEVVSTPMTCVATNSPVLALGARAVWADVDPWTGNISAEDVARKCTRRTKAIVVVHWGGYPCDLAQLAEIAREWSIPLIEDASHALGSEYLGRRIGGHSDFVCFSFQAIKLLTTGDGGALVCKSVADDHRARRLRWYGLDRRIEMGDECRWEQDIDEHGYKFHMNDIAATIGCEQLRYLDANLDKHRAHAAHYDDVLKNFCNVRPLHRSVDRRSAHWLYTMRVAQRAAFISQMRSAGVAASRVHVRNDCYTMFAPSACDGLVGVDAFDAEQVNIPCGWWLSPGDVDAVIDALCRFEAAP
jgi:dTDP-4-amino-4,6-dideoxygalactose transaminase